MSPSKASPANSPGSAYGPGTNSTLLDRAVAHQQAGRVNEATQLYEKLLTTEPNNPYVLNVAGVGYAQSGDFHRSIQLLQDATRRYPDYVDAHINLALALKEVGRFKDAILEQQRVLELIPDYAEGYNDLGILMRRIGQLENAEVAYRRALAVEPNYGEALANLGNTLQDQDKMTEAVAYYRKAIAVLPEVAAVHRQLGTALQRLNALDEAIESYRRAIEIAPEFALAYTDLGSALIECGNAHEGAECLRHAVELDPHQIDAYTNLGIALYDLGDVRDALQAYDDSLALEPGNSHAIAYKTIALHSLGREGDVRYFVDFDRLITSKQVGSPENYDNLSELNAALVEYAATHPTLMGRDDRRPGITGELFVNAQGPVRDLVGLIKDAVRDFIEKIPAGIEQHPFVANQPSKLRIIGWANVLDKGADSHIHPHAWLSGVYYAKPPQAPADSAGDSAAGWLEVGRPDPQRYDAADYDVRLIQPVAGRIVLFPSYVWHRVLPFTSQEKRVSYAFDILKDV